MMEILGDRQSWIEGLSHTSSDCGLGASDGEGAASILASLGPLARKALPALREALQADSDRVRFGAARAIWKVSGDAATALPILVELPEEETGLFSFNPPFPNLIFHIPVKKESLLELLKEMSPAALPQLCRFLRHGNHPARLAAAREAAPRLREMLGEPGEQLEVILALRRALRRIENEKEALR
jgi:HEAT repeat protein